MLEKDVNKESVQRGLDLPEIISLKRDKQTLQDSPVVEHILYFKCIEFVSVEQCADFEKFALIVAPSRSAGPARGCFRRGNFDSSGSGVIASPDSGL